MYSVYFRIHTLMGKFRTYRGVCAEGPNCEARRISRTKYYVPLFVGWMDFVSTNVGSYHGHVEHIFPVALL
jgi:hypothetical protein